MYNVFKGLEENKKSLDMDDIDSGDQRKIIFNVVYAKRSAWPQSILRRPEELLYFAGHPDGLTA